MGNIWNIKDRYKAVMNHEIRGDRGIWSGGIDPAVNTIDFAEISSLGNAADFGDLKGNRYYHSACGNSTRYIAMAGVAPADASTNDVEYVTIATKGNGAFFSDATVENREMVGLSNEIRGISGGGSSPYINVIEYITIASVGTDGADFGDLAANTGYMGGFASPTRGVFIGGNPGSSPNELNVIQYITIATTGNTTDFGDLTTTVSNTRGASSSVRGVRMGGYTSPGRTVTCDHVTIASTGDATDFGDLTQARANPGCTSNATRAIAAGGNTPTIVNTMDYITIASTGDAADFGDLTVSLHHHEGSSNGHGGINQDVLQRPSVTYMPGSGRALFGGGIQPSSTNVIDFITTSTLGNAVDFGNLRFNRYYHTAFASSIRFFSMAGVDGTGATAHTDDIEYVNFASQGNCSFFSDGTVTNRQMTGFSNATRGVSGGASSPYIDVIEYVVLASVGTDGLDFGNLSANRSYMGGFASPTRGVFVGGFAPSASKNIIEYITIASTGNATDFGDLTETARNCGGMASETRGLRFSGESTNVIDYVTIASTGDAADFGDATAARGDASTAASSTRGVGAGGITPSYVNTIDYVTIATTGDAADFGDLTVSASHHEGSSDSHGGLHG